ncbi:hypothetical protein CSHISOI_02736, partial [Colletotrichum shisoi]
MHRSTILCALSAIVSLAYAGDFSKSCRNLAYQTTSVSASCDNGSDGSVRASINMEGCLANVGGTLVVGDPCLPLRAASSPPSFKFCDCGLAGDRTVLSCQCTDSTGKKKPTSIDL